jgi:hypothetical protein
LGGKLTLFFIISVSYLGLTPNRAVLLSVLRSDLRQVKKLRRRIDSISGLVDEKGQTEI